MGGCEGSAAREALRHKSVEKVAMCDIDQVYIYIRIIAIIKLLSLRIFLLWEKLNKFVDIDDAPCFNFPGTI